MGESDYFSSLSPLQPGEAMVKDLNSISHKAHKSGLWPKCYFLFLYVHLYTSTCTGQKSILGEVSSLISLTFFFFCASAAVYDIQVGTVVTDLETLHSTQWRVECLQ